MSGPQTIVEEIRSYINSLSAIAGVPILFIRLDMDISGGNPNLFKEKVLSECKKAKSQGIERINVLASFNFEGNETAEQMADMITEELDWK